MASHPAAVPTVVPLGLSFPVESVTKMLLLVVPRAVPTVGIQPTPVPVFTVAEVPSPKSLLVTVTLLESGCPFTVVSVPTRHAAVFTYCG